MPALTSCKTLGNHLLEARGTITLQESTGQGAHPPAQPRLISATNKRSAATCHSQLSVSVPGSKFPGTSVNFGRDPVLAGDTATPTWSSSYERDSYQRYYGIKTLQQGQPVQYEVDNSALPSTSGRCGTSTISTTAISKGSNNLHSNIVGSMLSSAGSSLPVGQQQAKFSPGAESKCRVQHDAELHGSRRGTALRGGSAAHSRLKSS